jgi:hypothetical protein
MAVDLGGSQTCPGVTGRGYKRLPPFFEPHHFLIVPLIEYAKPACRQRQPEEETDGLARGRHKVA